MDPKERIKQQHGGPHLDGHSPQGPYWKRMHHSPFFWVAAFFILVAMLIFVFTDGLLFRPVSAGAPATAVRP
jgi:hypothetical protein